jgi:hypothetical protein
VRKKDTSSSSSGMNTKGPRNPDLKRKNKHSLLLNNKELAAINHYCDRYKIRNKSKFMRETIITEILRKFDQDYPSLFADQPNLFSQSQS